MGLTKMAFSLVSVMALNSPAHSSAAPREGIYELTCSSTKTAAKPGYPPIQRNVQFGLKALYVNGVIADVIGNGGGGSVIPTSFDFCSTNKIQPRTGLPHLCGIWNTKGGGYDMERTTERRDDNTQVKYGWDEITAYLSGDGTVVQSTWRGENKRDPRVDGMVTVETGSCTFK